MATINHGASLSDSGTHTVDALTKAMILHPVACALAFAAFLLSCGAGVVGSLLGAAVGALAWVLALVVMAIDFSIFGVCLSSFYPLASVFHLVPFSLDPILHTLQSLTPLPTLKARD